MASGNDKGESLWGAGRSSHAGSTLDLNSDQSPEWWGLCNITSELCPETAGEQRAAPITASPDIKGRQHPCNVPAVGPAGIGTGRGRRYTSVLRYSPDDVQWPRRQR